MGVAADAMFPKYGSKINLSLIIRNATYKMSHTDETMRVMNELPFHEELWKIH